MNVIDTILQRAARYGRRTAIIEGESRLNFDDLRRRVTDEAGTLKAMPSRPVRLGMPLANSTEDIVLAMAAMLAGHTLIALAPQATEHEKSSHLQCCKAEFLLARRDGRLSFSPLDASSRFPVTAQPIAFIRPTSGTTGKSKGVMLSHDCIGARIDSVTTALDLSPQDIVVWTMAASHHFASSILAYLMVGTGIVLAPNTLPGTILSLAHAHKATVLYGSPWQFGTLAAATPHSLPHLRWAFSTGLPLSASTAESFERTFGRPLRQAYGIIEAGLVCIDTLAVPISPMTVGPTAPGFEIRIIDEMGRKLQNGQVGEVCIRGAGLFSGYASPEREMAGVDQDGYFHSGDLGLMDGGCVFLKGRKASQLNVGGFKFFPEEIEAVLEAHPGVKQARVLGIPEPRIGHIVIAEIVPSQDATLNRREILAHCRRFLERYKIPMDMRIVPAIPETGTGKIKRIPQ